MLARIWLYLREMYPPLPTFAIAMVSFFNLWFLLAALDKQPPVVCWPALGGGLTLFLFLLFLRISDEFKDLETDRRLFPERLVPSGRVLESDLRWLMGFAIVGMLLLNLVTGVPLAFAVLMGFGVLMYHYFFFRRAISGSLLLALITHNPSTALMNAYATAVFCHYFQLPLGQISHLAPIVFFWMPGLFWELSRKIRAPQDETDYETYSKIFGYRLAALLPLGVLAIQFGLLLYLSGPLGLPGPFVGGWALLLLGVAAFFVRFLRRPDSRSARLKPVAEAYMLLTSIGLLIQLLLLRGVQWNL